MEACAHRYKNDDGCVEHLQMQGTDDELRDGLDLECILSVVMRKGRLRWFGHVERMDDSNKVKGVRSRNVTGVVNRVRHRQHGMRSLKFFRKMGLNMKATRG